MNPSTDFEQISFNPINFFNDQDEDMRDPIQYIHIKRIFKTVSHFFLLLCSFWEISKYHVPRVIVPSHFKRMFDF